MTGNWTAQRVEALAPDTASAKAGQGLSSPRKWVSLGQNDRALWGECQGSGSTPYQVQVDLSEPAFKCSCPSRKFPCKHGLGLMLMYAANPANLAPGDPPEWVSAWLAKRDEKAEKLAAPPAPEAAPEARQEPSKQALRRESRVASGAENLTLWLRDIVRQGLTSISGRPYSFFDETAARLVDAQAPGLARMVSQMAGLPASGDGWQERALQRIGLIQLLIEAYRNLDALSPETQSDVRTAIGWNVKQEEVLLADPVTDVWTVVGVRTYQEDWLTVRRTWLMGHRTGRSALLITYTRQGQAQEAFVPFGETIQADLCYFPGAWPQRALIRGRQPGVAETGLTAYPHSEAMLAAYARALAANPWLEQFPALIDDVTPVCEREQWYILDSERCMLPLPRDFAGIWKLLAMSGGAPVRLFGEWDGVCLLPLSVWSSGWLVSLSAE